MDNRRESNGQSQEMGSPEKIEGSSGHNEAMEQVETKETSLPGQNKRETQSTETSLTTTPQRSLSKIEKDLLKIYMEKHLESSKGIFDDEKEKKWLIKTISTELSIPEKDVAKLYKKAKEDYFASIKRLPAETQINQINAEAEILKQEVYNNSTEDILYKAKEIMNINDKLAKINKLYDANPVTNIYFETDLDINELMRAPIQKGEIL